MSSAEKWKWPCLYPLQDGTRCLECITCQENAMPSDGSWFAVREYRLCVEYGDGRTAYKPLPPKISKSAAFTHAANYRLGRGATVSVESRVVSAWHGERFGFEG